MSRPEKTLPLISSSAIRPPLSPRSRSPSISTRRQTSPGPAADGLTGREEASCLRAVAAAAGRCVRFRFLLLLVMMTAGRRRVTKTGTVQQDSDKGRTGGTAMQVTTQEMTLRRCEMSVRGHGKVTASDVALFPRTRPARAASPLSHVLFRLFRVPCWQYTSSHLCFSFALHIQLISSAPFA